MVTKIRRTPIEGGGLGINNDDMRKNGSRDDFASRVLVYAKATFHVLRATIRRGRVTPFTLDRKTGDIVEPGADDEPNY